MKKILSLGTLALAGVLAFTGCSCGKDDVETYVGTYKYENPYAAGSYYGAAVSVAVVDGEIVDVTLATDEQTGWTNLSAARGNWTEENRKAWTDGCEEYLASFVGMSVEDVLALTVTKSTAGEPNKVEGIDIITGATQSSGRVLLAIQNALASYNK